LAAWKQRNRNPNVLEERRRNAVQLMLRGDIRKIDLSESLGVSYTSIKNWWNVFEDNGNSIEALAPKKREGRRPRMNRQQLRRLERMLLKGPMEFGFETDLWTTERVASVIEQKFGIKYHPDHVRKILHNSLNFSPQKPEGIARERDEKKRANWVKNVLPEIKKS
jgi:transposase